MGREEGGGEAGGGGGGVGDNMMNIRSHGVDIHASTHASL